MLYNTFLDDVLKARDKLKQAEQESDLQTEAEGFKVTLKRKRKVVKKLYDSGSTSDDDEGDDSKTIRKRVHQEMPNFFSSLPADDILLVSSHGK